MIRRTLDHTFEYVLLLCAVAATGGIVAVKLRHNSGAARATPTCRDIGATPDSDREGSCRTASALLTTVRDEHPLKIPGVMRAQVLTAWETAASTPSGRRRNRMRLTVRLKVTNLAANPIFGDAGDPIYLGINGHRLAPDKAAQRLRGAFPAQRAIAPSGSATGTLRFELAGGDTVAVQRADVATLGLRPVDKPRAGRLLSVGVIRIRPKT
jgi:hypothetical protein